MKTGSIGFTGTQDGMTDDQKRVVRLLVWFASTVGTALHIGDCVGADEDFYEICKGLAQKSFWFVGHPPEDDKKRAFCEYDHSFPPKPYLDRNKDIVAQAGVLIATPNSSTEQLRSGTWATIRYAEQKDIPIIIVCPDGTIVER